MPRQIVLGLGAGHCGLELLAEVLNKQPASHFTFQQFPLLPWIRPTNRPLMRERLDRWHSTRLQRFFGDVASFYLPYLDDAWDVDPSIRVVCLQRPHEEMVAGFCRVVEQQLRLRLNPFAQQPAPGWDFDPQWTRIYPQYDTNDFEQGVRRYLSEYYDRAREVAQKQPERFLLIDTERLTTEGGVREMLSFCGFPRTDQIPITGKRPGPLPNTPVAHLGPRSQNPMDPRRCVILVPFSGFIHQECDEALKELERRGYGVRRVGGYAAIDQGRNQMATDALLDGYEETLWIDSDVGFNPDDVDKLRAHQLPIVCGIYPQKGKRALACHIGPGSQSMTFGKDGGLVELLYAGTGFLLIRREVYQTLLKELQLPICNERFGHAMFPFFLPLIREIEEGFWYLAEDYAFCHRARQCGYRIFADTTIRLWHIGMYRYGWEDAGTEYQRFASFNLNFSDQPHLSIQRDASRDPLVEAFAARYPWPSNKPDVPSPPIRDWFFPTTREQLAKTAPRDARLIVELGSWTGRSTRFLADHAPASTVIAIDHWQGSSDMEDDAELVAFFPRLYETFLSECWLYRDRIVPLRSDSLIGLRLVAEAGLSPDVIYVDADHSYEAVSAELSLILDLFPRAKVVGDDFNWEGVQRAVSEIARDRGLTVDVHGVAWRIVSA